jgi:hypothetical protein
MPNNITNRLTIICDNDRRREILEAIKLEKHGLGSIDFETIIPPPSDIYRGNVGSKEVKLYGENTLLAWSAANWDTKWNSYGYENFPEYSGGSEICFYTAWNRPEPIIQKLSEMYPDVQFGHQWADDDIGHNVGEALYANGEIIERDIPTGGSKEAYEMASDIIGVPLSDYELYYSQTKGSYVSRGELVCLDWDELNSALEEFGGDAVRNACVENEDESEEYGGMNLS